MKEDVITIGDSTISTVNLGTISGTNSIMDTTSTVDWLSSTNSTHITTITGSNGTWLGSGSGGYTVGGYSWTNTPTNVNIDGSGIDIKNNGDIKIDGKSLKEFMTKVEQRLSILVPDPEKLEKFEALKRAYEHYKTMEALCFPEKEDKK